MQSQHVPVLLQEVLDYMQLKGNEIVVDGTINGGGHSFAIAQQLQEEGVLIGIDLDAKALAVSRERLKNVSPQVHLVQGNFQDIDMLVKNLGYQTVDRILLDLGWSTNQFEDAERGFSFRYDGPLKMTLSQDESKYPFTAWHVVNEWDESSLASIFQYYGEERFAKRIAHSIVEERKKHSVDTTFALASLVEKAIPQRFHKKGLHPATKVFQAIRIAVNDEIEVLRKGLAHGFQTLSSGGRLLVITFHSIEDRVVKRFMRERELQEKAIRINKKPIQASAEELARNPKARSAKLRVLEKK